MYRSRGKGSGRRGRGNNGSSATKVPLKGLFSDGVWKCNCDPRLPAQHFQTKNGGKNHGRWFYTCQHPQPKRCDFFLWDDEAKGREAAAVLNNSRTEPGISPAHVTPSKPITNLGLATPQTGGRYRGWDSEEVRTPYDQNPVVKNLARNGTSGRDNETQNTATTIGASDEEFFDWPASDEEELSKAADNVVRGSNIRPAAREMPPPLPETPRKAAKTDAMVTPGKRRYDDMNAPAGKAYPTPATAAELDGGDVFATAKTNLTNGNGLFANKASGDGVFDSPAEAPTPTPIRYKDVGLGQGAEAELAAEILTTLTAHAVALPADAREAVKGICNRHVLYTRGIMKGRDVSRAMVKRKDEKVVAMQAEVEALKSERETNRAVIRHLRRDMVLWKEANA